MKQKVESEVESALRDSGLFSIYLVSMVLFCAIAALIGFIGSLFGLWKFQSLVFVIWIVGSPIVATLLSLPHLVSKIVKIIAGGIDTTLQELDIIHKEITRAQTDIHGLSRQVYDLSKKEIDAFHEGIIGVRKDIHDIDEDIHAIDVETRELNEEGQSLLRAEIAEVQNDVQSLEAALANLSEEVGRLGGSRGSYT